MTRGSSFLGRGWGEPSLDSWLALNWKGYVHTMQFTSLCRPMRVDAMEPVGMQYNSMINALKRKAKKSAMASASTVSLMVRKEFVGSLCCCELGCELVFCVSVSFFFIPI